MRGRGSGMRILRGHRGGGIGGDMRVGGDGCEYDVIAGEDGAE